jgi:hypothetical protein
MAAQHAFVIPGDDCVRRVTKGSASSGIVPSDVRPGRDRRDHVGLFASVDIFINWAGVFRLIGVAPIASTIFLLNMCLRAVAPHGSRHQLGDAGWV